MSDGVEPAAASPLDAARPHLGTVREGPYGPIGPGARVTYAWAAPLALAGIMVVSVVPALVAAILATLPVVASGGPEGAQDAQALVLLIALVVQFPAMALIAILWVRGFERRSLASAGFRGPAPVRRYLTGVAMGVGIAAVMALLSPLADPGATPSLDGFDASRLLGWPWLLLLGGAAVLFFIQSASEEIACRGWMLSAVSARRGLVAGALVSSGAFAALHVHFFRADTGEATVVLLAILAIVTMWGGLGRWGLAAALMLSAMALWLTPWSLNPDDLVFGVVAMLAVGCVGLFLALWAIKERSIAGVCGVHGGFNATIMIMGVVAIAGTTPDASPREVIVQVFEEATAMGGDASLPGALLQLVVFAVLSALVWRALRRQR